MNSELNPLVQVGLTFTSPWWFNGFVYPHLQSIGPMEFDVRSIEQHIIPGQDTAEWICGTTIHQFHIENDLLAGDFGIQEMCALEERELQFYLQYFPHVMGVGWKSAAYDLAHRPNDIYIPFICVRTDKKGVRFLLRDWCKIDNAHTLMKSKAFRYK